MKNTGKKGASTLFTVGLLAGFFVMSAMSAAFVAFAGEAAQYIGIEKAKSIALAHAKVSEAEIRELDVEFDHRAGRPVYEVEFERGRMEYQYDVDAVTGEVLRWKTKQD
jgi:uncharacterized membrane protein YkoI